MEIRVSPSILQKFLDFETGKWNTTKQQVIDSINKVPYPTSEAMAKGTAFHELTEKPELQKLDIIKSVYPYKLWYFTQKTVDEITNYRKGGIHEKMVEKIVEINGHRVLLYGKIDTMKANLGIDVKTGKKFYGFGQHIKAAQWRIYSLVGNMPDFCYAITDFKKCYYDMYAFNEIHHDTLMEDVSRFISFVDRNHKKCTHERFFDMKLDNPI